MADLGGLRVALRRHRKNTDRRESTVRQDTRKTATGELLAYVRFDLPRQAQPLARKLQQRMPAVARHAVADA